METKLVTAENCCESSYKNFLKALEGKGKRAAIFTHAYPDPDAIGSIMGLDWLLTKMGYEVTGFYDGSVSHPQNIAMMNLLDPAIRPVANYKPEDFDIRFLVDTVPANAGTGKKDSKDGKEAKNDVKFDVVIDHHREIPNGGFSGLFINLKAGSCCATIHCLISNSGYKFEEDNDQDSKVVTALLVGISTDTEYMMSEDTTSYEFDAWSNMFEFKNPTILKRIVNYERPKFWIDHKADAVKNVVIEEGKCIVGVGNIPGKHRDMIADMADEMIKWEEVHTAIAFAVVDGDHIEGSVRSRNASVMVPNVCKELGSKFGSGGGKLGKGAYRFALAGGGIDEDDDDDIKCKTWHLLKEKETKRIQRIVKG